MKTLYELVWLRADKSSVCVCGQVVSKGSRVAYFPELGEVVCRNCGLIWQEDLFEQVTSAYPCNVGILIKGLAFFEVLLPLKKYYL